MSGTAALTYRAFVLKEHRLLLYGVLMTLFSSFGQTFLVSQFVPGLLERFAIHTGQFGTLYALATLTSGLSLPIFGRLLDRTDLVRFSVAVATGLAVACWTMALARNILLLFAGLVGLRLFGQALLGLTASTAMARLFVEFRGRALSLTTLGYPLGEALFPVLVVRLIGRAGWGATWGLLGLAVGGLLVPAICGLVRGSARKAPGASAAARQGRDAGAGDRVPDFLRDARFLLLVPSSMAGPFVVTGVLLYQLPLAEAKGWSSALMAHGFVVFAAVRLVASLGIGPVVDRFGPSRLVAFVQVPLILGLVAAREGSQPWVVFVMFLLMGLTIGSGGVLLTSLYAQLFGIHCLGRLKGITAMVAVVSSAGSPVLLGWLLRYGVSFDVILPGLAGVSGCAAACAAVACALRRGPRVLNGTNPPKSRRPDLVGIRDTTQKGKHTA